MKKCCWVATWDTRYFELAETQYQQGLADFLWRTPPPPIKISCNVAKPAPRLTAPPGLNRFCQIVDVNRQVARDMLSPAQNGGLLTCKRLATVETDRAMKSQNAPSQADIQKEFRSVKICAVMCGIGIVGAIATFNIFVLPKFARSSFDSINETVRAIAATNQHSMTKRRAAIQAEPSCRTTYVDSTTPKALADGINDE